ncbi:hypothetical protein JXA88_14835 [Candidatus Fermentibacteria bacterium]|nr:hypothetical protein [Candidatus Fermentibacteria bacterium]
MRHCLASAVICLILELCAAATPPMVPYSRQWHVKLQGLPPSGVLTKLDLSGPGLEAVKQ